MQPIPTATSLAPATAAAPARRNGTSTVPLLSVRHLQTYYFTDEGVVKSVDDASFDLYPRQTLGIVGESGCGKSVTARSILRIVERPGRIVNGEILWRGGPGQLPGLTPADAAEGASGPNGGGGRSASIERAPQATGGLSPATDLAKLEADGKAMRAIRGAGISIVFQEPMTSFSPVHTIGNQIIEVIRLHRSVSAKEARARTVELLKQVGVSRPEQRVDEYPFQLSGGLRQRAMIAMALACDPQLLIADEPTTALDVTTQAQILDLLRRLQEERHMAIMLITHNLGVVAEMADEVVVMYLGRVVEKASVDDLFHAPQHPYTQALLRSLPTLEDAPRQPLPTIAGSIPHPFNRPKGCPFHPRCTSFMPGTCDAYEPQLRPSGPGHEVSCFLYHQPPAAS